MDKFDDFFLKTNEHKTKIKDFSSQFIPIKQRFFRQYYFSLRSQGTIQLKLAIGVLRLQKDVKNQFQMNFTFKIEDGSWNGTDNLHFYIHEVLVKTKIAFLKKKNCARWWEIRWYCWSGKIGETTMRSLNRLTLGLKPPGVDSWLVRIPSHGLSSKCPLVNPGMSKVHSTFRHNCYWNSMYYRPRAQLCRGFSRVSIQS